MAKKEKNIKNYRASEAWTARKKAINSGDTTARICQRLYRLACLEQRENTHRMTDKNREELKRLTAT